VWPPVRATAAKTCTAQAEQSRIVALSLTAKASVGKIRLTRAPRESRETVASPASEPETDYGELSVDSSTGSNRDTHQISSSSKT
jgi:hypothetical protein